MFSSFQIVFNYYQIGTPSKEQYIIREIHTTQRGPEIRALLIRDLVLAVGLYCPVMLVACACKPALLNKPAAHCCQID